MSRGRATQRFGILADTVAPFTFMPRPMISDTQRALVRDSWGRITPLSADAAALFYQRLFELDPSLQPLFAHTDMTAQGQKLMQMLDVAVAQLDRLDTLVPAVAALGQRHAQYGVRDEDYATVGAALLWTLERGLGPSFTPEVREAWTTTYKTLASAMVAPHDARAA